MRPRASAHAGPERPPRRRPGRRAPALRSVDACSC
jgi:hypothetical protein